MEELKQSDLQPDESTVVPRVKMGEMGAVGLKVSAKQIIEEADRDLRFPNLIKVVDKMKKDPTLATALHLYRMMIGRVNWKVKAPMGASAKSKERAKFIETCMGDMEHSWQNFIMEMLSYMEYGFSVHEKVYRRRLPLQGSKYSDGLVGWRKLPIRSQSTIYGWLYDQDAREITGVEQYLYNVSDPLQSPNAYMALNKIQIPRKKFLLFTSDSQRGNPTGNSPLKAAYIPWRYRILVEENEAIGVTRDLGGIPVAHIPPRYMAPDASPEEKAVYEYYKGIVRNIHSNQQAGLVLPNAFDNEARQPLFKFELLTSQGGKAYDTGAIIQRYENKMLMCLFADILKLGQDQVGSFALASGKNNILSMALEYRLREIQDVLNFDLIPQTFAMNGWDDTEFPTFEYSDFEDIDLQDFSAAIQRIFAVGAIEVDREVLNRVREAIGVSPKPEDEPVDKENLSGQGVKSKSGESLNTPSGGMNGTGKSVSSDDSSVSNKENV